MRAKIDFEIAMKAWENWYNFHHGLDCEELHERFCNFVDPDNDNYFDYWDGDAEDDDGNLCNTQLQPDCVERFKMLAGPHHHTLIKAYYAKNPWKQS